MMETQAVGFVGGNQQKRRRPDLADRQALRSLVTLLQNIATCQNFKVKPLILMLLKNHKVAEEQAP